MSAAVRLPSYRPTIRSPHLVASFPCFQVAAEGTQLLDRSGRGNNAVFGAALLASAAFATPNRLSIASSATGVNTGAPFLTAAQLGFNYLTDSLMMSGVVNIPAAASTRHILGMGSDNSTKTGWALRILSSADATVAQRNRVQMIVYAAAASGAGSGGTIFGTASTGQQLADSTDHHLIVLIDGPRSRMYVFIDGLLDPVSNGAAEYADGLYGLPFAAAFNNSQSLQAVGPLLIGGQPNTITNVPATAYALTPDSTSYGWQILVRKNGSPPANFGAIARRLAKTPTRDLTAAEWA